MPGGQNHKNSDLTARRGSIISPLCGCVAVCILNTLVTFLGLRVHSSLGHSGTLGENLNFRAKPVTLVFTITLPHSTHRYLQARLLFILVDEGLLPLRPDQYSPVPLKKSKVYARIRALILVSWIVTHECLMYLNSLQ